MERYKCRFCFKSFINGSALGGHMRSHMLTLSSKRELYQEEERPPSQLSEETESDASSSFDEEEEEDHLKSTRVDDKEMEFGISESETESSRNINPTRRRSKRTRKLGSFDFDFKKLKTVQAGETEHHHSSASDTTTEEDLASGQALGGHKRSHGINNMVSGRVLSVNGVVRIPKEVKDHRMIDLNLPAPNEEDHEPSVVFDEW
ncbi:Zinc finger protein ZAT4 [Raphanus sativus]|nr:Zinc finger protein ZAT4 [Raphanus sativus]